MSLRKSYFAAGLDALVRDTALPGMKTKEKWTIQDQDDIKASNERFRKLEKSTQAKRTALIKDAMAQVSVQQAYVVAEAFVKAIEGAARVLEEVQETARPKAETPAIGKSAPKSVVKAPSITGIQKQCV